MAEIIDHHLSGRTASDEAPTTTPVATDDTPALPASSAIESVDLFAKDGIGITEDLGYCNR